MRNYDSILPEGILNGSSIVDRSADLAEWVEVLKTVHKRKIQILAFANNHYAGYGPGTVELFGELWRRAVGGKTGSSRSRGMVRA
jgi:hypothetical protein